jgi:hypothetical protein
MINKNPNITRHSDMKDSSTDNPINPNDSVRSDHDTLADSADNPNDIFIRVIIFTLHEC